mgnify:CR=1 FL=1
MGITVETAEAGRGVGTADEEGEAWGPARETCQRTGKRDRRGLGKGVAKVGGQTVEGCFSRPSALGCAGEILIVSSKDPSEARVSLSSSQENWEYF